jgi:hypothetical protein
MGNSVIISAGMPKAGSAWIYCILRDCAVAAGGRDPAEIRDRYNLHHFMRFANCNIGTLTQEKLSSLTRIAALEGTFAVKTHDGPSEALVAAIETGAAKVVYIFRDPRDAVLAAVEAGKKAANGGAPDTFSRLTSADAAIDAALSWCRIAVQYLSAQTVVRCVRYEDMMMDPVATTHSVLTHMRMALPNPMVDKIVARYAAGNLDDSTKALLHFGKGTGARYDMLPVGPLKEEIARRLKDVTLRLGYPA